MTKNVFQQNNTLIGRYNNNIIMGTMFHEYMETPFIVNAETPARIVKLKKSGGGRRRRGSGDAVCVNQPRANSNKPCEYTSDWFCSIVC